MIAVFMGDKCGFTALKWGLGALLCLGEHRLSLISGRLSHIAR